MKNLFTLLFCVAFLSLHSQKEVFSADITVTSTSPKGVKGDFIVKGKKVAVLKSKDESAIPTTIIDNKKKEYFDLKRVAGKKVAVKNLKTDPAVYSSSRPTANQDWAATMPTKLGSSEEIASKMEKSLKHIKATKETRKIDGFDCVKVVGKNTESQITAWVAKDIPVDFTDLVTEVKNFQLVSQLTNPYNGVQGLIIEMNKKDLATGMSYSTNLTIQKKEISDSRFEIPESYTVTDMSLFTKKKAVITEGKQSATSRAFEIQKMVREQQNAAPAPEAAPEAPATKPATPAKTAPKE